VFIRYKVHVTTTQLFSLVYTMLYARYVMVRFGLQLWVNIYQVDSHMSY